MPGAIESGRSSFRFYEVAHEAPMANDDPRVWGMVGYQPVGATHAALMRMHQAMILGFGQQDVAQQRGYWTNPGSDIPCAGPQPGCIFIVIESERGTGNTGNTFWEEFSDAAWKIAEGMGPTEAVLAGGAKFATIGIGRNRSLRPLGQLLETVDDVLINPKLLSGRTPAQVQTIIGKAPGWQVETLRKGSKKGQGWVFREYNPTGRSLRWHPGGGHHGPEPYWRVTSSAGGKSDVIR